MRCRFAVMVGVVGCAAPLFLARDLGAAPGETKVQSERSSGSGTVSGGLFGGEGNPSGVSADQYSLQANPFEVARTRRLWGLGVDLESHLALVQTEPDDSRTRPAKAYNYLEISPSLYPTRYDVIRADLGLFEFFTADPNESGLRLADFVLSYTRLVPIATETEAAPAVPPMRGVLLRMEGDLTAPTSFDVPGSSQRSQLRSVITVPRLRIYTDKAFLDRTLILGANTFGEYYIVQYRTEAGGGVNPQARLAFEVTADYRFPFWRPLSIGALADTSYVWYYGIDSSPAPPYGVVGDAQYQRQSIQQFYGAEVHARYAFPAWRDVRSSASIAYAIGDNTVLHDGVQHLYFAFYRRASEVYATLTARY